VTFRASGQASVLDPVTRRRTAWRNGGAVELAPGQSLFVEFTPSPKFGVWRLTLPDGEGAKGPVEMDEPQSWSSLPAFSREAQAFSGTATYETVFTLPDDGEYELDLGAVETIARVVVNGREAATLWRQPYRCTLAGLVRKGENTLRVEVSNTWRNRIIHDIPLPEEKRRTWIAPTKHYWPTATDAFDPSGISGPVTLRKTMR
jgi:hypothetical protein